MSETVNIKEGGEIDLYELVGFIWQKKWFIFKVASIFLLIGIIVALTSPEEYSTSTTLIPEASGEETKLGGSLGGLASLAGVDLGRLAGNSQTINPALYQSVSKSTPFLLELMNQEYHFAAISQEVSLYEYYKEHHKRSLFKKLLQLPSDVKDLIIREPRDFEQEVQDSSLVLMTEKQKKIIEDLESRVFVEMDWELNVLKIRVKMQDPVVAAKMTHFVQEYITEYVTKYAISKGEQQLSSIEELYKSRRKEYQMAQIRLAEFRDKNQNITTAKVRSEEERLRAEYNLSFNIFDQIAQQREAIKIKIQERIPVFTILEPVKVPVEKDSPRRVLIVCVSIFFGVMFSIVFILLKRNINEYLNRRDNDST